MEQETSDFVLFFGRFHPMILHFPIGFLFMAFVLEVMSRFRRFRQYKAAVGLVLLLGAVSAVVAAVLGFMLAQGGGYSEDLLAVHQWSGIGVALFSVVAFFLYRQAQQTASGMWDKAYISSLSVMALALTVAGHYGGSLTHGSDYLTQYMPNGMRMLAGLPPKEKKGSLQKITNLPEAVVYTDIIYPILDARCVSCHNASKSKGDLQMHTTEALMKGGESGAALVAGSAEESELMKRIHLPENDDEHMPPEGKTQLTDAQVKLLSWWINGGADFTKTVAQMETDEDMQAVLNTLVDPDAGKSEVEVLLASSVTPADKQLLQQLQQRGVKVMPLAAEVQWLQADVPQNRSADSLLQELTKVGEQLTWLDLGGTNATDDALASVAAFKNLTRLHLENTSVTDKGLAHIKGLQYLEYLNLYGTQVTDEGIQQLAALKNLKKLYLWQTKVSRTGAEQLQQAIPGLDINLGVVQPAAAAAGASADTAGLSMHINE